jgi:hypothetical protein
VDIQSFLVTMVVFLLLFNAAIRLSTKRALLAASRQKKRGESSGEFDVPAKSRKVCDICYPREALHPGGAPHPCEILHS